MTKEEQLIDRLLKLFPKGKDSIGHVLEKIHWTYFAQTALLWQPCGFIRSLQEIAEDWDGEVRCAMCYERGVVCDCGGTGEIRILKPEAKALFQFLINLNL